MKKIVVFLFLMVAVPGLAAAFISGEKSDVDTVGPLPSIDHISERFYSYTHTRPTLITHDSVRSFDDPEWYGVDRDGNYRICVIGFKVVYGRPWVPWIIESVKLKVTVRPDGSAVDLPESCFLPYASRLIFVWTDAGLGVKRMIEDKFR